MIPNDSRTSPRPAAPLAHVPESRAPQRTSRSRTRHTLRPSLEAVEERVLLSTYKVISTSDSGAGSLSWAIAQSNNNPAPTNQTNEIDFDINNNGTNEFVQHDGLSYAEVLVQTQLPDITSPVVIDGTNTATDTSVVLTSPLSSTGAGMVDDGFVIDAASVTIENTVLCDFSNALIDFTSNAEGGTLSGDKFDLLINYDSTAPLTWKSPSYAVIDDADYTTISHALYYTPIEVQSSYDNIYNNSGTGDIELDNAQYNTIGGTVASLGNIVGGVVSLTGSSNNTIENNQLFEGISVQGGDHNLISQNTFPNPEGITLSPDPNTAPANDNEPSPIFTGVNPANGSQVTINGTASGQPNSNVTVEFFGSPQPTDNNARVVGAKFLGSLQPTTDSTGVATFSFTYTPDPANPVITATATDSLGNTSELNVANNAPSLYYLTNSQTVTENGGPTPLGLSGYLISLWGWNDGRLEVDLSANHGVLTLPDTTNLSVTGNGTEALSLTGTIANVENALSGVTYTPEADSTQGDSVSITATTFAPTEFGGNESGTHTETITIAGPPSVTPASTVGTVQTTAGLVITPGSSGLPGATAFKITGITGGSLFLNDGTTPVPEGGYVTLTQGAAGLKFTPSAGFTGKAGFSVQASSDGKDAGLGGGTAQAMITVTATTAPTNLNLSTSPFSATALAGTVVGTLSATDPNPGDTLKYSLTNNAGGRFVLSGNQVEVSPGATLSPSTYSITAQATDQEGQSVTQTFSLTAVSVTRAFSGLTAQDKTVSYGTSTDQLTGTIKAGSQVPTGTVTASVGGVVSQAVPISSTGSFTINLPTGSLAASATPYPVTYSYAGAGNFAAAQDSSTSITVTKAPLTVTASNASRAFDGANPTFGDNITGFVDGQTLATSGVTGSPSLTTTAAASSQPGTYPITASAGTLSATNYDLTFANGTLTVNPSPTVTVVSPFVVTNTNDSGIGSLRFAIQAANADLNHDDTITFQIPTTDPRYHGATRSWTIPVGAGLTVAKPSSEGGQHVVVIDGLSQQSQPGASHTHPVIEITPAAGFAGDGLTLNSGGNTVQGLVIDGFQGAGLVLNSGANNNLVVGNFIGTDPTGTVGRGNSLDGISLNGVSNNRIIGNVVSGNGIKKDAAGINPDAAGINLESNDSNNIIAGNEIGTNAAGDRTLGNSLHGIFLGNGSNNNMIGGPTDNDRNVISGNGQFPVANLAAQGGVGVYIYGANTSGNVVQGNFIGTNASGDNLGNDALTNSVIGVLISQSSGNTVQDNLISGNRFVGLEIAGGAGGTASGNLVQDNKIGTNFDGTRAIPNGQDGITINDAPNNMIGGTAASAGNLISGNGSVGIQLFGPLTQGNVIEGNALGLNSANRLTLPNRKEGIFVNTQPLSNTIGGTAPGQANRGQIPPPYTVSGSQQSNPGSTAQAATAAGRRFRIRGLARRSLPAHSTAHQPMTGGVS